MIGGGLGCFISYEMGSFVVPAVYKVLLTVITSGVSTVIFFFVFKIIFPEGNANKKD